MRIIIVLILSFIFQQAYGIDNYLVYYNTNPTYDRIQDYDLFVFDSDHHPPLEQFKDNEKVILGYLSIGEIEQYRAFYNKALKLDMVLEENTDWPGSYIIDIRNTLWHALIIEELIPNILFKGFNGIFLDTIDSPLSFEGRGQKYQGMEAAAISLVRSIRTHYPDMKIMVNRGYPIILDIASSIDYFMAESLYTDFDFKSKTYQYAKKQFYHDQLNSIQKLKQAHPQVTVVSLDYWDIKDTQTIKEIYRTQRQNGLVPYVSTLELNQVVSEPK